MVVQQTTLTEWTVELMYIVDDRWGTMMDAEGNSRTRLIDNPCGGKMMQCGVLQWIARVEFKKLDRNLDGVMTREEYEVRYTAERRLTDNGFGASEFLCACAAAAAALACACSCACDCACACAYSCDCT